MKSYLGLAFLLGFFFHGARCDYLFPRSRSFHREKVHQIQLASPQGNMGQPSQWECSLGQHCSPGKKFIGFSLSFFGNVIQGWSSPCGSFSPRQNKLACFDKMFTKSRSFFKEMIHQIQFTFLQDKTSQPTPWECFLDLNCYMGK